VSDSTRDTETPRAAAAQFAEMARKITENAGNGFSGAVLAFPPGGDPIELLLLANAGDESLFWGTLMTQVQIRLGQLKDAEAQGAQGWGRR
jgi:hypothetical protein